MGLSHENSPALECPSFNRFAWRKARPQAHDPGTWYNSCENTASVKRLTAS